MSMQPILLMQDQDHRPPAEVLNQQLQSEQIKLLGFELAPATQHSYDKHIQYFIRFLIMLNWLHNWDDIPFIAEEALPKFCTFLARSCIGDTIKTYLRGVRHWYIAKLNCNPLQGNELVRKIVKAQQRKQPSRQHRKLPMTVDMLILLIKLSNVDDAFEVACIIAALIAFFAFLRKANITVDSNSPWDDHTLRRQDITLDKARAIIWVTLHLTKTKGHTTIDPLRIPVPCMPNSILDPGLWWTRHNRLSPAELSISSNTHAFAYKAADGSLQSLKHADFVRFIRHKLKLALPQVDAKDFSHQSFRRGGATFAFACKVPDPFIKAMGDWLSEAYLNYIELDELVRVAVADRFRATCLQSDSGPFNPAARLLDSPFLDK